METQTPLNRLQFLLAAEAIAAAMLLPVLSRASEERLEIGCGQYIYEVVHVWLTPPDFLRFGDTQGLAQDMHGSINPTFVISGRNVRPITMKQEQAHALTVP